MNIHIAGHQPPSIQPPKPIVSSGEPVQVASSPEVPQDHSPQLSLSPAGSATPLDFIDEQTLKTSIPQARHYLQQVAQGESTVMKPTATGELTPPQVYQTQPLRTEEERKRAKRGILSPPHDNTQAHLLETLMDLRRSHPNKPVDLADALKAFQKEKEKSHLDELVAREYKGGPIMYAPYQMQDMHYTLATDAVFREALGQVDRTAVKSAAKDLNRWLGFRSVIVTNDDEKRSLERLSALPPREFFAVLEQETGYELLEELIAGKTGQPILEKQLKDLADIISAPGLDTNNLKTYVQQYWQPMRRWGVSSYQD